MLYVKYGGINMKKLKKVFCLIFICMMVLSGCNNKVDVKGDNESEIQASSNLNTDKQNEEKNSTIYDAKIISMDSNTSEKKIISDIKIDDNLSMNDKVNIIIKEVSKLQFKNAPIELIKIDNNIAYINIKEDKENKLWSNKFFQGSTGASVTTYTIVESLLQRDYKGKWIDGIYITYEGKTNVEFDHIDVDFFGSVIKR
jgi:PBP1b-binding outer membrane lipoprotein LpoB